MEIVGVALVVVTEVDAEVELNGLSEIKEKEKHITSEIHILQNMMFGRHATKAFSILL